MKNIDISNNFANMEQAFSNCQTYFPAKIGFKIQKNIQNLYILVKEIDAAKELIGKHYGTKKEQGYLINQDKMEEAQKELNDLMDVDQNVDLLYLKLSEIENISFTLDQIKALSFMIVNE